MPNKYFCSSLQKFCDAPILFKNPDIVCKECHLNRDAPCNKEEIKEPFEKHKLLCQKIPKLQDLGIVLIKRLFV